MSSKTKKFKEKTKEILTSHHRMAEVMRFEDYAANYDPNCYHVLEKDRSTTVLISNFYGEQHQTPEPYKLPNMYWAELRDAKIIGGSDVVLTSDNKMLYDMLAQCDEYHANMTDHGLFLLFNKPHHAGKYYIYSFRHIHDNCLEKGICLASNMSNNYFHFMAQVASKMVYIQATGINKDVPLLVDERVLQVPQMKQLVEILNEDHRAIIPLRANALYKIKELYCIGCPNIVIPNSKKDSQNEIITNQFAYDVRALDDIKTKVLSKTNFEDSIQFPKRIYLSRRNCNKRRINEDELRPILEKYGFEFVYTEDMDIITQARLFNQAEHIVGASGAAFTNLIFCSKGCRVLVFLSRYHYSTCYSSLGSAKGASMMFIAGVSRSSGLHVPYYNLNADTLESYFQSIYNS